MVTALGSVRPWARDSGALALLPPKLGSLPRPAAAAGADARELCWVYVGLGLRVSQVSTGSIWS